MKAKTFYVQVHGDVIHDEFSNLLDAQNSLVTSKHLNPEIWEVKRRYRREIIANIVEVED